MNQHRRSIPGASALVLLAATVCAHSSLGQQRAVPFQRFVDGFYKSHGIRAADASSVKLSELLDTSYLSIRLGALDLRYPAGTPGTAKSRHQLKQILARLLDLQREWYAWLSGAAGATDVDQETKVLRRWILAWKDAKLGKAAASGGGDLLASMGPNEAEAEAARKLTELMFAARGTGNAKEAAKPSLIVLTPEREQFLELVAYLGTIDEQNRAIFWQDNMAQRSQCWVPFPVEMQIIALQYAHPDQKGDDFTTGYDMDIREKTGLLQHVVQQAASSMTRDYLGGELDAAFAGGLNQNLTIAVCKENNARAGGDGKAHSGDGMGGFVAGGASRGGSFLGLNFDSRWRATLGRHYFIKPLARGQRAGAKRAADPKPKQAHFLLQTHDQAQSFVVDAPFLGTPAKGQRALPDPFVDDFKEFHRAYRSGFVYWLQTAGAESAKDSAAKFGELLRALANDPSKGAGFEAICREVYGMPLSDVSPKPESLEWRFLTWLLTK